MTTHAGGMGAAPKRPSPARHASTRERARAVRRATRRAFRAPRAWPALLVALVMLAVGVIAAIEVISAAFGSPLNLLPYGRVVSWATTTTWQDAATLAIASVIAALGLGCLLLGLLPGHSRLVPLRADDPELVIGVTRRGLRRFIASAATGVDGVSGVGKIALRRRRHRIAVRVNTALHDSEGLADRVKAAVEARVGELEPRPRPSVAVKVRGRKG